MEAARCILLIVFNTKSENIRSVLASFGFSSATSHFGLNYLSIRLKRDVLCNVEVGFFLHGLFYETIESNLKWHDRECK